MTSLLLADVNSLRAVLPRLDAYLETVQLSALNKVSALDVTVAPDATEAIVRIRLAVPAKETVIGTYLTRNGVGTNENFQYLRKSGTFIFQPGDIEVAVPITLKGNNKVGNTVDLVLSSTISGASILDPVGTIRFGVAVDAPTGFTKFYETDFVTAFAANDSGKLEDGSPCWQSRPSHGRSQDGNQELGVYADPVVFPGTDPFPVVDGKRVLRSEKLATPIVYNGKAWNYTASMITSQMLPKLTLGDRVECRLAMPVAGKRGAWPAFWLLASNNQWNSDYREIDMLEWPIKGDSNAWTYYTTQHWLQNGHVSRSYPLDIRTLGIAEDLTGFHTYGVTIGEQLLFDIDGKLTVAMENRAPDASWYVLLNMAMGGTWPGSPTTGTEFPCDMILDWIKFYTPI